jgi:hypothetical protein
MKSKLRARKVRLSGALSHRLIEEVKMAADPAIRAECAAISKEFAAAEADGLRND